MGLSELLVLVEVRASAFYSSARDFTQLVSLQANEETRKDVPIDISMDDRISVQDSYKFQGHWPRFRPNHINLCIHMRHDQCFYQKRPTVP